MISVEVTAPGGDRYRLDTPDAKLVGPWLAALFADLQQPRIHLLFTINIQ